jgi:hypothetical protein
MESSDRCNLHEREVITDNIASSPSVATAVAVVVAVVGSTRSFKRRRRRRWQLEGPKFELPSLLPSILPLSLLFTPDRTTDSSTETTSREASRQMSQGGMSSSRSESRPPLDLKLKALPRPTSKQSHVLCSRELVFPSYRTVRYINLD